MHPRAALHRRRQHLSRAETGRLLRRLAEEVEQGRLVLDPQTAAPLLQLPRSLAVQVLVEEEATRPVTQIYTLQLAWQVPGPGGTTVLPA